MIIAGRWCYFPTCTNHEVTCYCRQHAHNPSNPRTNPKTQRRSASPTGIGPRHAGCWRAGWKLTAKKQNPNPENPEDARFTPQQEASASAILQSIQIHTRSTRKYRPRPISGLTFRSANLQSRLSQNVETLSHDGQAPDPRTGAVNVPICLSSTYNSKPSRNTAAGNTPAFRIPPATR
jgi:hypothetical protein